MEAIRKELSLYGKKILEKGLAAGPGGNISARDGDFVYLSPSGFALDEIRENEWVKVDLRTGKAAGTLRPTCETSMHLGIYLAREDVRAVFHTHPPLTTGLVSAGVPFRPLFPDFVAILGRKVPVIPYVIPGGEEIRRAVVARIRHHDVVLLKNHGAVCVGSLKEAFVRSWLLEETSKVIIAGTTCGKLRYLTETEIRGIENLEAEDYRKMLLKQ